MKPTKGAGMSGDVEYRIRCICGWEATRNTIRDVAAAKTEHRRARHPSERVRDRADFTVSVVWRTAQQET